MKKINELDLSGKKVIVRADLDVGESEEDQFRLKALVPTLEYLKDRNCEIVIIGHKGRPMGKVDDQLSLKPVSEHLEKLLKGLWGEEEMKKLRMNMMENLRFEIGEEENDFEYAKHLAENGDYYINEAFSASHREHASIVGLPKILPHAAGLRFIKEVENLSRLFDAPKPVIAIIGGLKKDKLDYLDGLKSIADKILIAGRLPEFMPENLVDERYCVAKLIPDKEDITIHSIEKFIDEIGTAKTILVAGPIGKYEDEGHRMGTERVFNAVAESQALKIAGGGDTVSAIYSIGISDKFHWISVGGGATLEFLTKRTLPGIEALLN